MAEATAILGRAVVEEAMADLDHAAALFTRHAAAVEVAAEGLRERRHNVASAREYADSLPHEVRVALAGAWAGDAGKRAIGATGLEESE